MEMIADILLVAGAMAAGFYCFVLARRLNRFNDLEKGVGGAVAVLSAQVEDLSKTLAAAKSASDGSNDALNDLTTRAETVAQRLELMMASMHDMPKEESTDPEEVDSEAQERPLSSVGPAKAGSASGPMFVRHNRGTAGAQQ